MEDLRLNLPLDQAALSSLRAGQRLLLSGVIYCARDAAHQRLVALLDAGQELPFDVRGQAIYYVGPTPAKPGAIIGSAGPTTSYRMDDYAPKLLDAGLRIMIGKGMRGEAVVASMIKNGAVYLGATGGAGALLARSIRAVETVAYPELGPEAVRRMEVLDFPAMVIIDARGNNLYELGPKAYLESLA